MLPHYQSPDGTFNFFFFSTEKTEISKMELLFSSDLLSSPCSCLNLHDEVFNHRKTLICS